MPDISFHDHVLPLKDKLFRLALRITFNRAEAEDVVQETLIRVWSKRDEWNKLDSIEAYCLTIARHLAIDRSELMDFRNVELTERQELSPDPSTPYDHLVEKEQWQLLHRLIEELPERQRTIIHLRDVEGMSYKEIAALLQQSEEQVKVNLHRARQKLKQRFMDIDDYGL